MPKFIEGRIECPFYIAEGKGFITCEGVLRNTRCVQKFKTDKQKICHEELVCSVNGGRGCEHYKTVFSLYERGLRS